MSASEIEQKAREIEANITSNPEHLRDCVSVLAVYVAQLASKIRSINTGLQELGARFDE